VVAHHCWLTTYSGYPSNIGPAWTGWLLYGHFAVVVFIVLSGFSLAVSPARSGWRLGGLARFAHRRAWRILPPYWAALAFSLAVAWTVLPPPDEPDPSAKTVAVYGLLLQDVFDAPSPNGAFWSIAVEAQLYVAFPLLLAILRRAGAAAMLTAVTAVVVAIGLLAPVVPALALLLRLVPQFAVLFALGMIAAGVLRKPGKANWPWLAALAAVPVFAVIVHSGSVWYVGHLYWIDLAIGPAVALALAGVATGRPAALVRFLDRRPMRRLGSFSYSLYLTHAPIVWVVSQRLVDPYVPAGVPRLVANLAVSVPATIGAAWLFGSVFELPFQRYRSWNALRAAVKLTVR
jgi:peptidoglycan/LPS O-acetylase OafA/YrhL